MEESLRTIRGGGNSLPDGVTYSIEPSNITLTPGSKATVTMRISAGPNSGARSYNLELQIIEEKESYSAGVGHSTVLTIVEGTSPAAPTNGTKSIISYINRPVTSTHTSMSISTFTTTLTSTVTSTTTATSVERITEHSIYAWAIGATAVAAVFAIVLLRKKK